MSIRFISTKVHGVLDYLTSAAQFLVPNLLGFSKRASAIHYTAASITAGQSLLTDYELSAANAIPMKTHLTLDAVVGGALIGSAVLLCDEDDTTRSVMAGVGGLYLLSALFTKTQRKYPVRPTRMQRLARARYGQFGQPMGSSTTRPGVVEPVQAAENI